MTPLWGTKTPSAPVGDKSGGGRRAARSLLSCALWRGKGRLWRGMGGMGRPEPLSAHRPRRQQGLSGFHETRNTKHETRNTNHGFFRNTAFTAVRFDVGAKRSHNQQPLPGPLLLSRNHCFHVHFCSPLFTIVHYCSLLFAIVHYCSLKNISRSQCSITVRRFRSASRRAPFAAAPVSLRVAFAAAIAKMDPC